MLNKAIAAIEEENDALDNILRNNIDFPPARTFSFANSSANSVYLLN